MSTSVSFPVGIAPALGHLNSGLNDIEIFVEDTASRNMWIHILKKIMPAGVRFNNPIQLGGRIRVLDECELDQAEDGRKRLYLIDSDLDLLTVRNVPALKYLFKLNAYCVENYLIAERAIVEACMIIDTNIAYEVAAATMAFPDWVLTIRQPANRIFVCYAVVKMLQEDIVTVGYHASRVCRDRPNADELCSRKIFSRVFALYRSVIKSHGARAVKACRDEVSLRADQMDFRRYVSGKDYLLNLICARMKRHFGNQLRDEQIKVLIASLLSEPIDVSLRDTIQHQFTQ